MNIVGLDIETAPVGDAPAEHALQPWRLTTGEAQITLLGLYESAKKYTTLEVLDTLDLDPHTYYATWNGIFDVSWLYLAGVEVERINWLDGMLLWKWLENSQAKEFRPAWSLKDAARRFLGDWPYLETFLKVKAQNIQAGVNKRYWQQRCVLDAKVTRMIVLRIWKQLTKRQRTSALIEAQNIAAIAKSSVTGILLDYTHIKAIEPGIIREMREIETKLRVLNQDAADWSPSKVLRSPSQLSVLLYDTWRLPCKHRTPKQKPATNKTALTYLADVDDRALDILRWRKLNTSLVKFIQAPQKARSYLRQERVYPTPKIFSTYTGRMTYASKTAKKYPTGIALHQWARDKSLRRLIQAG